MRNICAIHRITRRNVLFVHCALCLFAPNCDCCARSLDNNNILPVCGAAFLGNRHILKIVRYCVKCFVIDCNQFHSKFILYYLETYICLEFVFEIRIWVVQICIYEILNTHKCRHRVSKANNQLLCIRLMFFFWVFFFVWLYNSRWSQYKCVFIVRWMFCALFAINHKTVLFTELIVQLDCISRVCVC